MYSLLSGQIPNNADKCLCHDSLNNPTNGSYECVKVVAVSSVEGYAIVTVPAMKDTFRFAIGDGVYLIEQALPITGLW